MIVETDPAGQVAGVGVVTETDPAGQVAGGTDVHYAKPNQYSNASWLYAAYVDF
jgi:hypothetical protein